MSIFSGGPACRKEDHCRDGVVTEVTPQDVSISLDESYIFDESSSYSLKHFPSLVSIAKSRDTNLY